MNLNDFNFHLPPELIAQQPKVSRDNSRLFIYDCQTAKTEHRNFYNLPDYLKSGDILVLNNTKVFPARLIGKKITGGKIEIFLLKQIKNVYKNRSKEYQNHAYGNLWQVLVGGKRRSANTIVNFNKSLQARILKQNSDNTWVVEFNLTGKKFWRQVDKVGEAPTPPYIKNKSNLKKYQTVFAANTGSVAAPTAGFHFTKPLLAKLAKQGVKIEFITLHVGLGTFAPVNSDNIKKHQLHAEYAKLNKATARNLNQAKNNGDRIIAVGTTTVRTLESFTDKNGQIRPQERWINTFIYPDYKFKFIDGLITNFHLPKSSLIMLVAALLQYKLGKKTSGAKLIKKLYQTAIKKGYRFYSFGDAMFIN